MKRIQLYMAAVNFALAQVNEANALTAAESSLAAFKAGGFDPEDLGQWQTYVQSARQTFGQMQTQKLPSEVTAAQKAAKIVPPGAAPIGAPV